MTPDGGYLCLMLHAHLPFVRHPEHDDFLEEDWLFEAITETYVPIFASLLRLRDDKVPYRIALSVTPPLAAMLDDSLLRFRYRRYLEKLTALCESEVRGNSEDSELGRVARHYLDRLRFIEKCLATWRGDVLAPLRDLQNAGFVEVLTCNATHGFLPLMSGVPARRAQIRAGVNAYSRSFGRRPRGMWLAECGYDHDLDQVLGSEGIDYVFMDGLGLQYGRPAPARGVFAPIRTPAGPAVFARDQETGRQVWSADEGYPGDPVYREFYRDIGWDAGYDYIRPYLHQDGVRRGVGLKYHRVTGRVPLHEKQLYAPDIAEGKAREHGWNFIFNRKHQLRALRGGDGSAIPPIIVSPYDAELFGHWWYEGPWFLEAVLRAAAADPDVETITPSAYLARHGDSLQVQRPNPSTWGVDSTNKVWLSGQNAWLYRYQHWCEREMTALVHRFGGRGGLHERALRQAGRELLLLQSSDWAFIMTTGTTPPYAAKRFKQHFANFTSLRNQLVNEDLREHEVSALEAGAPIFANLDVAAWG